MIDELISEEHISVIVEKLLAQSRQIQVHEKNERELMYPPYCTMRQKHNVTGMLLSALAPDRFTHKEIEVTDVKYGLHEMLGQPELKVDNAIMQVYSNGSDLKGKVISERCETFNCFDSRRPQFLLMVVAINGEGVISQIDIRRPDKSGKIVETKQVYTNIVPIANAM